MRAWKTMINASWFAFLIFGSSTRIKGVLWLLMNEKTDLQKNSCHTCYPGQDEIPAVGCPRHDEGATDYFSKEENPFTSSLPPCSKSWKLLTSPAEEEWKYCFQYNADHLDPFFHFHWDYDYRVMRFWLFRNLYNNLLLTIVIHERNYLLSRLFKTPLYPGCRGP